MPVGLILIFNFFSLGYTSFHIIRIRKVSTIYTMLMLTKGIESQPSVCLRFAYSTVFPTACMTYKTPQTNLNFKTRAIHILVISKSQTSDLATAKL